YLKKKCEEKINCDLCLSIVYVLATFGFICGSIRSYSLAQTYTQQHSYLPGPFGYNSCPETIKELYYLAKTSVIGGVITAFSFVVCPWIPLSLMIHPLNFFNLLIDSVKNSRILMFK